MASEIKIRYKKMKDIIHFISESARDACLMEVLAPKPGNVHPEGEWNFHDLKVIDFIKSAHAIKTALAELNHYELGHLVLIAVIETRKFVSTNTNLGQILLLVPIAIAFLENRELSVDTLQKVLMKSTVEDSIHVFQAIQLAGPGGMGKSETQDINDVPNLSLLEIMKIAADRDAIAMQLSTGFRGIFETGIPTLTTQWNQCENWKDAIVFCHLILMSKIPDTLIARKCGEKIANEAARRSAIVSDLPKNSIQFRTALSQFDEWLRLEGNKRNPGSTADLVTATLFVALLQGRISVPSEIELLVNNFSADRRD